MVQLCWDDTNLESVSHKGDSSRGYDYWYRVWHRRFGTGITVLLYGMTENAEDADLAVGVE